MLDYIKNKISDKIKLLILISLYSGFLLFGVSMSADFISSASVFFYIALAVSIIVFPHVLLHAINNLLGMLSKEDVEENDFKMNA